MLSRVQLQQNEAAASAALDAVLQIAAAPLLGDCPRFSREWHKRQAAERLRDYVLDLLREDLAAGDLADLLVDAEAAGLLGEFDGVAYRLRPPRPDPARRDRVAQLVLDYYYEYDFPPTHMPAPLQEKFDAFLAEIEDACRRSLAQAVDRGVFDRALEQAGQLGLLPASGEPAATAADAVH